MATLVKARKGRWNRHGGYAASAFEGRKKVGEIQAVKLRRGGQPVLEVAYIEALRHREGIGTKLYEQAAQDACEKGLLLASPRYARNTKSGGFWAKQERKGRTIRLDEDTLAVDCAHSADLSGLPQKAPVEIDEVYTGSNNVLKFEAYDANDNEVGRIIVKRKQQKIAGKTVWDVADVHVASKAQRKGIATKLYERAAAAVCQRRGNFASTERIAGAHSLDFWLKQERKGRAKRIARKREYHRAPPGKGPAMYDAFILDCAHSDDLSGLAGPGWRAKDERMYQHIKRSCLKKRPSCSAQRTKAGRRRKCYSACEAVAAATVNKHVGRRKK